MMGAGDPVEPTVEIMTAIQLLNDNIGGYLAASLTYLSQASFSLQSRTLARNRRRSCRVRCSACRADALSTAEVHFSYN
eukprot:209029-Amphidinium_carterae.2